MDWNQLGAAFVANLPAIIAAVGAFIAGLHAPQPGYCKPPENK